MAEMKLIENGIAKVANGRKRKTRRRRNPTAARATTARAAATRSVANPRKRRRRRNGVTAVSRVANPRRRRTTRRRRNGLLGDSKETVSSVLALGAGMVGSKIGGGLLAPFLNNFLTPVGLGAYGQVISQAAVTVLAVSPIARKLGGNNAAKFTMLGGLTLVALDFIDMMLPDNILSNPFNVNVNPIVIQQNPANQMASGNGAAMAGASGLWVDQSAY